MSTEELSATLRSVISIFEFFTDECLTDEEREIVAAFCPAQALEFCKQEVERIGA